MNAIEKLDAPRPSQMAPRYPPDLERDRDEGAVAPPRAALPDRRRDARRAGERSRASRGWTSARSGSQRSCGRCRSKSDASRAAPTAAQIEWERALRRAQTPRTRRPRPRTLAPAIVVRSSSAWSGSRRSAWWRGPASASAPPGTTRTGDRRRPRAGGRRARDSPSPPAAPHRSRSSRAATDPAARPHAVHRGADRRAGPAADAPRRDVAPRPASARSAGARRSVPRMIRRHRALVETAPPRPPHRVAVDLYRPELPSCRGGGSCRRGRWCATRRAGGGPTR